IDAGARPLGDAQQEDRLATELGGRRVERGHDLELRERRLHVACGEERVLLEPPPERGTFQADRHAVSRGISASSATTGGLVTACASSGADASSSRVRPTTRRPTFGQAISLPYS